jgi:hypothetical protein
LQKARSSRTKVFPPKGEFYWIKKASADYVLDWDRLIRNSLEQVLSNYRATPESAAGFSLAGISGLARYGERLAALESYVRPGFLIPQVLDYMAGNIEDFGTGGAAFRILYRDFLRQAAAERPGRGLEELLPAMDGCIAAWHALSAEFRTAARGMKKAGQAEKTHILGRIRSAAEEVYGKESAFYRELERVYTAW